MKIAIIAPYDLTVPPKNYGGIEAVVDKLVEGLVKKGHDVTLFAAEGSKTSAKLIAYTKPFGAISESREALLPNLVYLTRIFKQSDKFDIIHNNAGRLPLFFASFINTPFLTTLHSPLPKNENDVPPGKYLTMKEFSDLPYVSISDNQRTTFRDVNYIATVYNGTTDLDVYKYGEGGEYMTWIGGINEKKGPHIALGIAKEMNVAMKFAGKKDINSDYFDKKMKPLIDDKDIRYIGPVNEEEKITLLRSAKVFVNPIQWQEPFGLVVVEANACGTPVVSYELGAMSELIKNGVNGYLVKAGDKEGLKNAIKKIYDMPDEEYQKMRQNCREHIEKNFTIEKMVEGYEKAYKKAIADFRRKN